MNTELITLARKKSTLIKMGNRFVCPISFNLLDAVDFVLKMLGDKDAITITIDDFARAFHGRASKETRKKVKPQMRRLVDMLRTDGHAVGLYKENCRLAGMVFLVQVPEHDDEDVVNRMKECLRDAENRYENQERKLVELERTLEPFGVMRMRCG